MESSESSTEKSEDFQDVDDDVQKQVDQPLAPDAKAGDRSVFKLKGWGHPQKPVTGAKVGRPKKEIVDPKSLDTRS